MAKIEVQRREGLDTMGTWTPVWYDYLTEQGQYGSGFRDRHRARRAGLKHLEEKDG